MTPSLILSMPPVPGDAVAASPIAPVLPGAPEGGGAGAGNDAFAALLAGLEGPAIPVPVAANLPAPAGGAPLPGERQDLAGSGEPMLDCDTGLPVLPGLTDAPDLPGAIDTMPVQEVALPRPELGNLPARVEAEAKGGRLRAAVHARPLPMSAETAVAVPAPGTDPEARPATPGARRRELPVEPLFAPDAPIPVETPRPVQVALRVAETPAIERAAAALDPLPATGRWREPAAADNVPTLPAPEAVAPDAAPTPPTEEVAVALPAAAAAEPPAVDAGEAPPPPRAEPAPASTAKPELPPAFAGLTPAQPRPNAARPLPPGQRFDPAAATGQPAVVPLAPAAPATAPVEPLPVESVTAPRAPSFGFHPATPVAVRAAAEAVAPQPLPVDTARADWLQAMIERIGEIRTAEGHRGAQIRLLPDALGPVDIRIEQRESHVHVTLAAETAQARQLLAEAGPRLQDMAEAKGLRLTQSGVDGGAGQGRRQPPEQAPELRRAPPSARGAQSTPSPARDRIA